MKGVETFWLVDPLDGTGAFKKGYKNFTVNIALIHRHKSVLGVIYAPAKYKMYCGNLAGKSRAYTRHDKTSVPKNIKARKIPKEGLTIMTSGNSSEKALYREFMKRYKNTDKIASTIRCSSSIKMCYIASGEADLYLRIGPTMEWDTAAGHAIISAVGGDICGLDGKSILYGKKTGEKLYNPSFFVASSDAISQTQLLRELIENKNSEPPSLPS